MLYEAFSLLLSVSTHQPGGVEAFKKGEEKQLNTLNLKTKATEFVLAIPPPTKSNLQEKHTSETHESQALACKTRAQGPGPVSGRTSPLS